MTGASQRTRTDMNQRQHRIVAIDGPAGSGKTTLASRLADHFELTFLDTGLLYRATARRLLDMSAAADDREAAIKAAEVVSVDDLDPDSLMTEIIGQAASKVAAIPAVRTALLDFQRRFGEDCVGAVLVGRDIGTVVRPDATHKIFVTASVEQRAKRRCKQLQERGVAGCVSVTHAINRVRSRRWCRQRTRSFSIPRNNPSRWRSKMRRRSSPSAGLLPDLRGSSDTIDQPQPGW